MEIFPLGRNTMGREEMQALQALIALAGEVFIVASGMG